ncbi:MAG: helix-turn-helix transcriptional regulator [Myxococcota bacterium]|nr:helix-turn-helix transcriptional regulator [Myxococcota bacterium]
MPTPHTRKPAYRKFLTRLRQARREAGMTQVEAAKALRKPQSFISRAESGDRRVDVIELQQLARLYRKPIRFFFD